MVNRRKFYKLKIVSKENGSEDYFYYFNFPYLYNVTSEYIKNLEVGKKAVDTLPKKDKRKLIKLLIKNRLLKVFRSLDN